MKKISILALAIVSLATFSCKKEEIKVEETSVETPTEAQKIVSLNGAITEIAVALGYEKEIIGVDVTSTFPESVKSTATDLGHVRSISIESIVALQPTIILATEKDMNPELAEKINSLAEKHETSINNIVVSILEDFFKENEG